MFGLLHFEAGTTSTFISWMEDARALCLAAISKSENQNNPKYQINRFENTISNKYFTTGYKRLMIRTTFSNFLFYLH